MKTLHEIAQSTGTDKGDFHDYCRTYDELFTYLRERPVALLEMGVLAGQSLMMWARYFTNPQARILGIDIEPHRCELIGDERVTVRLASQTDAGFWRGLDGFDIIIDDAGHFASAQIECFKLAWPHVLGGGYYIVEDLHSYAAPELLGAPGSENVMQWLTRIAVEMQGRGAAARGKVEPDDLWASIDTITFRKGLAIIKKK
jgi:hypothetical protein